VPQQPADGGMHPRIGVLAIPFQQHCHHRLALLRRQRLAVVLAQSEDQSPPRRGVLLHQQALDQQFRIDPALPRSPDQPRPPTPPSRVLSRAETAAPPPRPARASAAPPPPSPAASPASPRRTAPPADATLTRPQASSHRAGRPATARRADNTSPPARGSAPDVRRLTAPATPRPDASRRPSRRSRSAAAGRYAA